MDARGTAGWFSWVSIFTSAGTLVCCALPALLVAIGAGAALAGAISVFPQLVWLSEHKVLVFSVAAVMLAGAGYFQWKARFAPCPTAPVLAASCESARRSALRIYQLSLAIFAVGGFFAFLAPLT